MYKGAHRMFLQIRNGSNLWLPSMGLPACLRAASAALPLVLIFSCALLAAEAVGVEVFMRPLAVEAPLSDGAAVVVDIGRGGR